MYKKKLGFPGKAKNSVFNNLDTAVSVHRNQKVAWMDLGIYGDFFDEVLHYLTFSVIRPFIDLV